MSAVYEIIVRGRLDPGWSGWLAGLELTHLDGPAGPDGGCTRLCGPLSDQAALHGLLERIRDLNLELISVNLLSSVNQDLACRQC